MNTSLKEIKQKTNSCRKWKKNCPRTEMETEKNKENKNWGNSGNGKSRKVKQEELRTQEPPTKYNRWKRKKSSIEDTTEEVGLLMKASVKSKKKKSWQNIQEIWDILKRLNLKMKRFEEAKEPQLKGQENILTKS